MGLALSRAKSSMNKYQQGILRWVTGIGSLLDASAKPKCAYEEVEPDEVTVPTAQTASLEIESMEHKALVLGMEYYNTVEGEVSVEKISDRAFLVSYIGSIAEGKSDVDALYVVEGELKAFMRN